MTDSPLLRTQESTPKAVRWLVGVICMLGAMRVLVFGLGFPVFNNVDELAHFDQVYRYSTCAWPKEGLTRIERETAIIMVLYNSNEYVTLKRLPGMSPGPMWQISGVREQGWFLPYVEKVRGLIWNYEAASLPMYYSGAGLWCTLGRWMGWKEVYLAYWIRLLNVPAFVLLIWIAYRIGILLFPGDLYYAIGLPLAAAFFPQDIYYGINSDAFSPVFFGITMVLLLRITQQPAATRHYAFAGLMIAATFLIKLSNFPIYILAIFLLGHKAIQLRREKGFDSRQIGGFVLLTATAVLPVAAWILWSRHELGDWTGAPAKIKYLGWTVKPVSQWLNHPIFSWEGMGTFLADLTKTYWRGEYDWDGKAIQSGWMDAFYVYLTGLLLAAAVLRLILDRGRSAVLVRCVNLAGLCMILMAVLFLGFLSIQFDYGNCPNPSREHPYFTSGRLVFCTFIPFLLLCMQGLRSMFFRYKNTAAPLVILSLIMIILFAGEILLNAPVFQSEYNWFHLP